MNYILFLFTYAIEASIRKYIFSSTSIILIKYLFLFNLKFKKNIFNYSLISSFLILPTIIHSLSKTNTTSIELIIYDLMAIFFAPIIILCVFTSDEIKNYKLAIKIIYLVIFVACLNSIFTIVQSLADPFALINISVAQDYGAHNFGQSYKVQGIFATASPFFSISGILGIWFIRDKIKNSYFSKITYFLELLIIFSTLFNLVSRTYVIYSFFPYLLLLIESLVQLIIKLKIKVKVFFFMIVSILSLIIFSNKVANYDDQNIFLSMGLKRYQGEYLNDRLTSYYSDILNIEKVPSLMEAPGLGTTVGTQTKDEAYLDSIEACKDTGREWDFSRLVCIFGFYGHFLILFCRLIPAIYLFIIKFKYYDKSIYKSSSFGISIVALMLLLQAQFNINDIFAGILSLSLTTNTIYKIGSYEAKN